METIKLSGRYDSTKSSIIKLVKTLEEQISRVNKLSKAKVFFDLSDVTYIDSNIAVIIYAYIKEIDNNTELDIIVKMPSDSKVNQVLFKNNFCSLWGDPSLPDINNTFVKIKGCININDCVNYTTSELFPMLDNLKMAKNNQYEFLEALFELNNNAFQHGKCDSLYVCGQFFPNNHFLNITYINFGKTFKQNYIKYIKRNNLSDFKESPIIWARKEGNSTEADSAGVGLLTFFDNLKKYNSQVIIFSDNEVYERDSNGERDNFIRDRFLGTIITIKFNLNEFNCIK